MVIPYVRGMSSMSLVYGGVKYKKVRHAILCKKCLETLESKDIHDFKTCSCNSVAIDGDRILGSAADIENRSVYCAIVHNNKIWLPYVR